MRAFTFGRAFDSYGGLDPNQSSMPAGEELDPLFEATPTEQEIGNALRLWPELAGKRVRPLLVTAFRDVFVEMDEGDVWVASPIELTCKRVAASAAELRELLTKPEWAQERLLTEVVLLASEQSVVRARHQVFAIAPHPLFTGSILAGNLVPMDLVVWHSIALQHR
jgi:hypothetical protein